MWGGVPKNAPSAHPCGASAPPSMAPHISDTPPHTRDANLVPATCLCVAIPWKSAPWYLCGHGEAFPGVSEAMDGFSQAHRDVLVASPGKASPCPHLHQGQNPR